MEKIYYLFLICFLICSCSHSSDEEGLQDEVISFIDESYSFEMVYVEGGTFLMGGDTLKYKTEVDSDELPQHNVTLSSYYIGKYPVTQELWEKVMHETPDNFVDPQKPMFGINWEDCMAFIDSLNRLTGKTFQLPTEAQWEFAARGGNKSKGYLYAGSDTLEYVSWNRYNSYDKLSSDDPNYGVHVVGTKLPNELGIYDMSGNVWNWCRDYYAAYSEESQVNPVGPDEGEKRVSRCGSWIDAAHGCRTTDRWGYIPTNRERGMGFRLVMEIEKP